MMKPADNIDQRDFQINVGLESIYALTNISLYLDQSMKVSSALTTSIAVMGGKLVGQKSEADLVLVSLAEGGKGNFTPGKDVTELYLAGKTSKSYS